MSNNELVDLFRSGETVPVKVTFNMDESVGV